MRRCLFLLVPSLFAFVMKLDLSSWAYPGPRISAMVCGKIEKCTIDALVDMLTKAGLLIEVSTSAA